MSHPNQLFLLADHIKLSLLERQRAQALNLGDDDAHDGHVARSVEQFGSGLEALKQQRDRLRQDGDEAGASSIEESLPSLQKQFDDLTAQFHGFANPSSSSPPNAETLTSPNSPTLARDFAHAASTTRGQPPTRKKSVRFSDTPPSPSEVEEALFGAGRYRDDPSAEDSAGYADEAAAMSNQQLHHYHSQILQQQDEQLDRLGESIGRQRELSMQMGDELDNHVALLDEVDNAVDRNQTRLDRASKMLNKVAKGASENKQMTTIVVLIIILVLLIAVLK
jgi:syntaxin 8